TISRTSTRSSTCDAAAILVCIHFPLAPAVRPGTLQCRGEAFTCDSARRRLFTPAAEAKGRMLRLAVAMGLALPGLALAAPSAAQAFGDLPADASVPEESLTAEQILERAQDRLRPPSVRRP